VDQYFDEKLGSFIQADWEKFCTQQNAEKAREDVQRIIETFHKAAEVHDDVGPFSSGFQVHGTSL
jgi:hypothetical protein